MMLWQNKKKKLRKILLVSMEAGQEDSKHLSF